MSHTPDLSIIIVTWNAWQPLAACLASLPAALGGLTAETWVVDNASSDGSAELVAGRFPWVRLQANRANVGFSAGNNQAARGAAGRYLLLLNPDTVASPGALAALAAAADAQPDVGCLGPRLVYPDGGPQRSCWRGYPGLGMALSDALYLWKTPGLPLARRSEYTPQELQGPREVDHLLGACLLIRREAWEQVGELDEGYFLFLEETDWCYRARAAGWRILFEPRVVLTHLGEHSVNQAPVRNLPTFYRSYCRFVRKHAPPRPLQIALLKQIIAVAALVRIGLWTARAGRRRDEAARRQARAMRAGYLQVLRELSAF